MMVKIKEEYLVTINHKTLIKIKINIMKIHKMMTPMMKMDQFKDKIKKYTLEFGKPSKEITPSTTS